MPNQITGLASGMDTQGLIKSIMDIEKKPVVRLNNQSTMLALKKGLYTSLSDKMINFQKTLMSLKLESTFQTKKVNSSNSSIITATAGVEAKSGSYTIQTKQVAQNAISKNTYSKVKLLSDGNTSGVTGLYGNSQTNLEGNYEFTFEDLTTYTRASSKLTLDKKSSIQKTKGSNIEGATENKFANTINKSNNRLNISYGDETFDIYLDFALSENTDISKVSSDLENKINKKLNELKGTKDITYVMAENENTNGTANTSFSLYNVNSQSNDFIKINDDGGADLANASLGFSTTTLTTTNAITKSTTATDFTTLRTKMNDESFLRGYDISSIDGLKEGKFEAAISSSLNATPKRGARVDGGSNISTTGIDPTKAGLNSLGLLKNITGTLDTDGKTNATFRINNAKIVLNDIDSLSMNDVIGIINGSEAGVTASYDNIDDKLVLKANDGTKEIKMGSVLDDTNFLEATKLSIAYGGTLYESSTSSNINVNSALATSGFATTITPGTATINGVSIYISNQDTLNDVMKKINNSSAGVIASYDSNSDNFSLRSDMETAESNEKQINIGSYYDTSNFFEVVNITGSQKANLQADLSSLNGDFTGDTIHFKAGSTETDIALSPTTGTGAYTDNLDLDFTTGISAGTSFMIAGGTDGSTVFHWTNNSGKAIYSKEDLMKEWNNEANWTDNGGAPSSVAVKMVSGQADNQIRLFNAYGGNSASFTIFNDVGDNISQLGISDGVIQNQHMNATATSAYNAFSMAWDIGWQFSFSGGMNITADDLGGMNFESTEAGMAGMFQFSDTTSSTASKIFKNSGRSTNYENIGSSGKDAIVDIDGIEYKRASNKIKDAIADVDLNINSVSSSPTTLDVNVDTDKVLNVIADFVVGYNSMIKRLNPTRLTDQQKKYLTPLTDTVKNNMSFVESDDYEKKFKEYNETNMILQESSIRGLSYQFRPNTTKIVENLTGKFNSLNSLGIKVGSTGDNDDRKMGYLLFSQNNTQSDEDYKKAILKDLKENNELLDNIKNNSTDIYKLFATDSDKKAEKGIARGLDEIIDGYVKRGGIFKEMTVTNGSIDKELITIFDQIKAYKMRNDKKEKSLYDQFAKMETQLSNIQAQSASFMAQMGSTSTQQ